MSEIKQDSIERVQEAPVSQLVLEKKFVRRSKADTTPSVLNVEKILFHNTAPVLVTRFNDVQPGQEITMLGDGFTTIENNAKQKPNSGVNTLLASGKVYRYTDFGGVLYEDADNVGAGGGGGGARGPAVIFVPEVAQPIEPRAIPGRPGNAGGIGATGKDGRPVIFAPEPAQPLEPMMIPGKSGVAGGTGATGKVGRDIRGLDGRDASEPFVIPGRDGKAGTAGATGAAGKTVLIPGIDGRDAEPTMVIPGKAGAAGGAGAVGAAGKTVIIPGLDGRDAQEPMVIPGKTGAAGAAGGGGFAMLTTEVNISPTPALARTGHFQIVGAGMVVGKPVYIQQAANPYTGKGTRADESEMDNVETKAYVLDATHIQVYWTTRTHVRGNFKFNYAVGA